MSRKEKILQKLNPSLLKTTPKLSGSVDAFVDLDSDDSLEDGAKRLMLRFFRNQDLCERNKRNLRRTETEATISSAEYNEKLEICKMKTEILMLPRDKNEEDVCDKPGRRLQKLKMELQEKMSAKWEEEYKKRVSQKKSYHKNEIKCVDDDDDNYDVKSLFEKDEDYDEGDEADIEDEEEKGNNSELEEEEEKKNKHEAEDTLYKDDEYDNCSLVPAYQPGGGMLYGGSELTQCDENLPQNLISPSLRLSINDSSKLSSEFQSNDTPKKAEKCPIANESFTVKTKLFSHSSNDSFDLNDAFEFCSGKFPDDHVESQWVNQNANIEDLVEDEQKEIDGGNNDDDDDDDDKEKQLDESEEKSESETETETEGFRSRKNIITFEDSEEEEEKEKETTPDNPEEPLSGDPALLSDDEDNSDLKKKNRKSLHFSDDEEDEEKVEEENEEEKENEEEDEDDLEQRSIHYDSEENEIINPKEFFEKEAELSGSEWSGDEDERGLDQFDVEDGDADEIDNDQVRSQLEKIHIRRVLDDDAREVRLIQEILFEDGDLHNDGKRRDRKFRWKNLGAFDEEGNQTGVKEDDGNTSDEDGAEENEQRKLRLEKELFLMGKKDGYFNSDEELENFPAIKVTTVKTAIKLSASENSLVTTNTRGSFLTRNEEFLSRLAKVTSGLTDNILGPKSSKNFVFATKSPEKGASERNTAWKRQIENADKGNRREKRLKIQPLEIDTGPSILDLLV